MRNVIRGLVVASLLLGSSASALARCGDRPGDMPAVHAVSASIAAQCGCCGRPLGPQRTTCIVPTVRAAARAGHLPRRCLGRAVRAARRSCPLECPPPMRAGKCFDTIGLACTDVACSPDQPCPLPNAFCNPRCLDASTCTSDADCDDGNPCSRDTCADGTCAHECLCVSPVGGTFTCCPGPAAECGPPPTTSTTLAPRSTCTSDADCDDGNPCSRDTCADGTCAHECLCVSPVGGTFTCCPGPAAECEPPPTTSTTLAPCGAGCRYYLTCGWPVCPIPAPPTGAPPCTTQELGAPCSERGERCDPGSTCGETLLCTDRDPTQPSCPISRRRFKDGVSYLDDAERGRLRAELMRIRLATYHYRWENSCTAEHLGFIIDDLGKSPAVSPDGMTVDLYGYASMAVAAIQAQEREIAALKGEVAALRHELDERKSSHR